MRNLAIDADRLWRSLMEMARIGATEAGGVNRQALTELDRDSRDLFVAWCRDAGCDVRIDAIGNIFARRPGSDDGLAPVMMGSHLDTQPTGGKFDGALGTLAALEVVRTLNDRDIATERPVEIAMWTNEEGCRFAPATGGSMAFAGLAEIDALAARTDRDGIALGAALDAIGYRGAAPVGGRDVAAFFELHIEQGPILENAGTTIGVVRAAQAQRWFDVTLTGQEAHAGPTPMDARHDALLGAARLVAAVNAVGLDHQPGGCATVGQLDVAPNSRNTIPGSVFLTVDLRHPDAAALESMIAGVRAAAEAIASDAGLELELREAMDLPGVAFDTECVGAVTAAAADCGLDHMEIVSGAGHDACNIARVAPTGMIFIPCAGGISHNEAESATKEDCAAGCEVLLNAVLERAGRNPKLTEPA